MKDRSQGRDNETGCDKTKHTMTGRDTSRPMNAARRKWLRRAGGDPKLAIDLYAVVKLRRRARRYGDWPFNRSLKFAKATPWWIGYAERAAEAEAFDRASL